MDPPKSTMLETVPGEEAEEEGAMSICWYTAKALFPTNVF